MQDIVILGAGGCARELLVLLEDNNAILSSNEKWNIIGFIGRGAEVGKMLLNLPIYGEDWLKRQNGLSVVCGLGEATLRHKAIIQLKSLNRSLRYPTLISRRAQISSYVKMGEGCIVCANCIMTCDITLGDFVTLNLGTIVTHDGTIGSFTQINPSCNLSGRVSIGELVQMGTGVKVIPGVSIEDRAIIGAGAIVTRNIPAGCTAVGCPAKVIKGPQS